MELTLLEAVPYLRAYSGATFVVKVGGDLLAVPAWRDRVARDVAILHRLGIRVILVHGGGPQLDAAAATAGIPTERVAGRRITDLQQQWLGGPSRTDVRVIGIVYETTAINRRINSRARTMIRDGLVHEVQAGISASVTCVTSRER